MRSLILLTILLISVLAHAFDTHFTFSNYGEAANSKNYLRFDLKSTKAGLFTSDVTGFVKNFSISGEQVGDIAKNIVISFDVESMDTDNSSRNEKMWGYCLNLTKNPKVEIKFKDNIDLSKQNISTFANLNLRGEDHPIEVSLTHKSSADQIEISGLSHLKFSQLKIPDPSIFIAKVHDNIEINFHLLIALRP